MLQSDEQSCHQSGHVPPQVAVEVTRGIVKAVEFPHADGVSRDVAKDHATAAGAEIDCRVK